MSFITIGALSLTQVQVSVGSKNQKLCGPRPTALDRELIN